MLYWNIGREILKQQRQSGWGAKVIDRIAFDLRKEFPEMSGLSPRNIKYMRALADAYPDETIVQQLVAQIPWGHNVRILDYVKDNAQRLWYIRKRSRTDGAAMFWCTRLNPGCIAVREKQLLISIPLFQLHNPILQNSR